jgi:hypothetical protein
MFKWFAEVKKYLEKIYNILMTIANTVRLSNCDEYFFENRMEEVSHAANFYDDKKLAIIRNEEWCCPILSIEGYGHIKSYKNGVLVNTVFFVKYKDRVRESHSITLSENACVESGLGSDGETYIIKLTD